MVLGCRGEEEEKEANRKESMCGDGRPAVWVSVSIRVRLTQDQGCFKLDNWYGEGLLDLFQVWGKGGVGVHRQADDHFGDVHSVKVNQVVAAKDWSSRPCKRKNGIADATTGTHHMMLLQHATYGYTTAPS